MCEGKKLGEKGKAEKIIEVLGKRPDDAKQKDDQGNSALHYLCRSGEANAHYVSILVDAKVEVNCRNDNGRTALHSTCAVGRHAIDVTQELLSRRANVNAKDAEGATPLHLICLHAQVDVAQELLRCRANVNRKDCKGATALHILYGLGVGPGKVEMVKELLQFRADRNIKDKQGETVLHALCTNSCFPNADYLLQAGSDVNACNKQKKTPLHSLCLCIGREPSQATVSCMSQLLEAKANVTLNDAEGQTCMDVLCNSFNKNHSAVRGMLCDSRLEHALFPLWLAQYATLYACVIFSQKENPQSAEYFLRRERKHIDFLLTSETP